MMKIIIAASIAVCLHGGFVSAQETKAAKKPFLDKKSLAVTASVGHTKDITLFSVIGTPNIFNNPLRPWYTFGMENTYRQSKRTRMYYGVELNYHDYKYVDKSLGATVVGGFEKRLYKGIYAGLGCGLGFQKAKRADVVYTFVNDIWVPSLYPGKWIYNRQNVRISAELGYKIPVFDFSAYVGANVMYVRRPYGTDVPLGLYQTPIKIGIRKGLANLL
jgi:hypothetical protein